MAQNEMKAEPALPERVRSMEGLGVVAPGAPVARLSREWCESKDIDLRAVIHVHDGERELFRVVAAGTVVMLAAHCRKLRRERNRIFNCLDESLG